MKTEDVFSGARKSTVRKERHESDAHVHREGSRTRLPCDTSPFAHDGSQTGSMLCPCNSFLTVIGGIYRVCRRRDTGTHLGFVCGWRRSIDRELGEG